MSLVSLSIALTACSGLKLGYNNADTLLNYLMSRQLDLDDAQKAQAAASTKALLQWHRATQLPAYVKLMTRIKARIAQVDAGQPIAPAEILALQREVNALMRTLGDHAAPDLARLALTLTPDQIDRYERKLTEDAAKARGEAARGTSSVEARVDKYVSSLEGWMGSLSTSQISVVRQVMTSSGNPHQMWLDEKAIRDREILGLLRRAQAEKPSLATVTRGFRQVFAEMDAPTDKDRAARVEARRALNARLIAEVLNAGDAEQRAQVIRKFQGYIDDLTAVQAPAG